MILGRVVGEVVATRKHPSHERRKVLMVQPITPEGADRGEVVLALDGMDAGAGDRVLVVQEGFAAMTAVNRPASPIDMSIVAVVDSVEVHES
jgi:ethanolamine utilization protein EutN